ncbi:MAG: hypothetical protein WAN76_06240 [Candidatus Sulfotelmatobacter sp.]
MTTPIPITAARPQRPEIIESRNACDRYEDAYLHARGLVQAGDIIQIVGWVLGAFIFCGAIFEAHTAITLLTPAADWIPPARLFIAAIMTVFLFWLVGVLVGTGGQRLKASLDSAVNSSPFLSDAQRAKVMSLS